VRFFGDTQYGGKIVSDDSNNALVNYAVKNSSAVAAMVSNTNAEAEKSAIWEKARKGAAYHWMIQYARIQEIKPSEQLLALRCCT
jgi:hypothetical protein